jgi:hypothetical protein
MARNAVKAVKGGRPLPAGRTVGPPRTFLPSSLELKRNVDASSHSSSRARWTTSVVAPTRCTLAVFREPHVSLPLPFSPSLPRSSFSCVNERPLRPANSAPDRRAEIDPRPGIHGTFGAERPSPPPLRRRENREKLAENLEISCFPSRDSSNRSEVFALNQIGDVRPFARVHRASR